MGHCSCISQGYKYFFSLLLDDVTPYGIWINYKKSAIVKAQLK